MDFVIVKSREPRKTISLCSLIVLSVMTILHSWFCFFNFVLLNPVLNNLMEHIRLD